MMYSHQSTKSFSFLQLLSLALMLCLSLPILSNEPMTKTEFAKQALSYKNSAQTDSKHVLEDDLSITTTRTDGSRYFTYLDNAYTEYVNAPDSLDNIFNRYLSAKDINLFDESTTESKLANLMPVLKDDTYIGNVKDMMQTQDPAATFPFYYESLNNGLNLLFAFDTEQSMQFLSAENIKELGVSAEQLKNRAINNLMTSVPELGISGDASYVSYLVADDNYEASFLLVDQLWTKENFPVQGEIVVFAMSRSSVLVTGSKDNEGIAAILNFVNAPDTQIPHALATTFHIRDGNKWKVFEPKI